MATKGGYQARDFTQGSTWTNPWTYLDPLNIGSFFDPTQIDAPASTTGGPSVAQSNYGGAVDQGLNAIRYGAGNATGRNQAALANQLYQQTLGYGPNPAMLQFQQSLDQANQQQAGAVANYRGISPAQQAQMISNGSAGMRLGGAQQAAILREQQMLAAQGQLGNVLGNERQQDIGQQQVDAGTLGQVGQLQYGQNSLNQQNQQYQQGLQLSTNEFNAQQQQQANNARMQFAGNVINSLSGGAGMFAAGGFGGGGGGGGYQGGYNGAAPSQGPSGYTFGNHGLDTGRMAHGGKVMDYRGGGKIPGKANVAGDSPKNDTVPIQASPGEIMIPRSITMSENAPEEAANFVAAHMGHADAIKKSKQFVKSLHKYAKGGEVETASEQAKEDKGAADLAKQLSALSKRVKMLEKHKAAA